MPHRKTHPFTSQKKRNEWASNLTAYTWLRQDLPMVSSKIKRNQLRFVAWWCQWWKYMAHNPCSTSNMSTNWGCPQTESRVAWWMNSPGVFLFVATDPITYEYICVNHACCIDFFSIYPIGSMYGIYSNIGGILMVNVTIYTIHGSYGYVYRIS